MRGLPTDLTALHEDDFREALEAWHCSAGGASPPQQPAEWVFPDDVEVTDDVGTAYEARSSALGGSGTMFRPDYVFTPGPPEGVASFTVRVGREGVATRVELADID